LQSEVTYLEDQQAQVVAKAKETIGNVASLQTEVISLQEQQANLHAKATSAIEQVALLQIRRLSLQESHSVAQGLAAYTEEEENLLHRQATSIQDIANRASEQVTSMIEDISTPPTAGRGRRRFSDPPARSIAREF